MTTLSYQGVSDRVAHDYMEQHRLLALLRGRPIFSQSSESFEKPA
jgi:hypothetical protein